MQRKLRGLQFHIDMEIRRSKTPMAACIKISEMMHGSLSKLRSALNDQSKQRQSAVITSRIEESFIENYPVSNSAAQRGNSVATNPVSAKVLSFKARSSHIS